MRVPSLIRGAKFKVAFVWDSHLTLRHRPPRTSESDEREIDSVIDHRPIHRRSNLSATATTEAFENFLGDRLEGIERTEITYARVAWAHCSFSYELLGALKGQSNLRISCSAFLYKCFNLDWSAFITARRLLKLRSSWRRLRNELV